MHLVPHRSVVCLACRRLMAKCYLNQWRLTMSFTAWNIAHWFRSVTMDVAHSLRPCSRRDSRANTEPTRGIDPLHAILCMEVVWSFMARDMPQVLSQASWWLWEMLWPACAYAFCEAKMAAKQRAPYNIRTSVSLVYDEKITVGWASLKLIFFMLVREHVCRYYSVWPANELTKLGFILRDDPHTVTNHINSACE